MRKNFIVYIISILWTTTVFAQWNIRPGDGKSLEAAFEQIESGSILVIPEGVYLISQPLAISGKESVIIRGEGKVEIMHNDAYSEVFLLEDVSRVVIKNLKLRHYLPDPNLTCVGDVLHLVNTRNVIIENCDLNGCGIVGVGGDDNAHLTLRNNFIHNNSYAAIRLFSHQGEHTYLFINEVEEMEGVIMEGNRIENNGTFDERVASIVGKAKWVDGADIRMEVYAASEKVKQINKSNKQGFKTYATGKMEGKFAGVEFGDFAHFSIVTQEYHFSFFVSQCPEYETFEQDEALIGKKVSIKWEERDMDLRAYSGAIERVFTVTAIELME